MELTETYNMDYIDAQYRQWQKDPDSVSKDWRYFFQGFEIAMGQGPLESGAIDPGMLQKQTRVQTLILRYRELGHFLSCTDPLTECPFDHPLLNLDAFGLSTDDLQQAFIAPGLSDNGPLPLQDIVGALKETYCRSIGVEYMHLQDPEEREWLRKRMEPIRNRPKIERETRLRVLRKLYEAAGFEAFLNKRYAAQTRFSLEGAEGLIPLLDWLLERSSEDGIKETILGMAHRGRLNVMVNILKKPYVEIFREFINSFDPDCIHGAGDVKYHNGYLSDQTLPNGRPMRLFMVYNPSHLESVDPVAQGITHARQNRPDRDSHGGVLPILLHGDAAFAGQGVVMETLNMSQLNGYGTYGTIHIVINNQIGYTTLPEHARSTRYSTEVAKMVMAPIFHVHGENIEALLHVAQLAADYRTTYGKDVVIDLVCYRRHGHNEGDEPYFTQPLMYERIRERPPVHKLYTDRIIEEGIATAEDIQDLEDEINRNLDQAFEEAREDPGACFFSYFYENWTGFTGDYSFAPIKTGVEPDKLRDLAARLNSIPEDFSLFSKLKRLLGKRLEAVESGEGIDWANAESLAFASILDEGDPIRLSGQDSGRGTFSQRHSVLVDTRSGEKYTPLTRIGPGKFTVLDSPLSETSVLGFEYGYSIVRPEGLVLWEAQFGDFANNAQSVIDLYITSGEQKWQRLSGLIMLLPHGWEGLGPEHSSARLERFLQLCAGDNIQVCYPTTPAQYFHLLRRQARSGYRKPLIVMAPKSLLRNPLAVSTVNDLASGHFQMVLDLNGEEDRKKARRVVLCSGKIYYDLRQRLESIQAGDTVLIRLEQIYPFPRQSLKTLIASCQAAEKWVWVQEEPENMGAYRFVKPRLEPLIDGTLEYIGRKASASPATGFANVYREEQAGIVTRAIGPESSE